jgi:DUF4097 and DUF4098 domain-containing protein YvlB
VVVPDGDVTLSTTTGDISVYDTFIPNGGIYLDTKSGGITVHNVTFNDWSFNTIDGDIFIDEIIVPQGDFTLSSNGDLSVYDTSILNGGIYLDTENGDISVYNVLFNDWEFKTLNGDIYVGGFTIPTRDLILSTNGDITVHRVTLEKGNLQIHTINGDVFISDLHIHNRRFNITTNGAISVWDTEGYVKATSVNGKITIKNTTGIYDLTTVKGDIRADLLDFKEDIEISTTRGNIRVSINPDLNANFEMKIHSLIGAIFLTNMKPLLDLNKLSFKHIQGVLGEGGNTIHITIGDEEKTTDIYGGFIILDKFKTRIFPYSSILTNILSRFT